MKFPLFALVFALATGADTSTLAPVITAMGTLVEIIGEVFTVMVGNPVLVVFLAAGLLGVGIKLFKKLKGAAKG